MERKGPPYDVEYREPRYWSGVALEACQNAWQDVIANKLVTFVSGVAVLFGGAGIHALRFGRAEGLASMESVLSGLYAIVGALAVFWFIHLVRIPAKRAGKMKEQLARSVPKDEYDRVVKEANEWKGKAESSLPEFSGTFEQIMTGENPEGPPGGAVVVTVRNTGEPSIAEHFQLQVVLNDGKQVETKIGWIDPQQPKVYFFGSGPTSIILPGQTPRPQQPSGIRITANEVICNRTLVPIPRGGLAKGWVPFECRGTTVDRIRQEGTTFVLTFKDIHGKEHKISHVLDGNATKELTIVPIG